MRSFQVTVTSCRNCPYAKRDNEFPDYFCYYTDSRTLIAIDDYLFEEIKTMPEWCPALKEKK